MGKPGVQPGIVGPLPWWRLTGEGMVSGGPVSVIYAPLCKMGVPVHYSGPHVCLGRRTPKKSHHRCPSGSLARAPLMRRRGLRLLP